MEIRNINIKKQGVKRYVAPRTHKNIQRQTCLRIFLCVVVLRVNFDTIIIDVHLIVRCFEVEFYQYFLRKFTIFSIVAVLSSKKG